MKHRRKREALVVPCINGRGDGVIEQRESVLVDITVLLLFNAAITKGWMSNCFCPG